MHKFAIIDSKASSKRGLKRLLQLIVFLLLVSFLVAAARAEQMALPDTEITDRPGGDSLASHACQSEIGPQVNGVAIGIRSGTSSTPSLILTIFNFTNDAIPFTASAPAALLFKIRDSKGRLVLMDDGNVAFGGPHILSLDPHSCKTLSRLFLSRVRDATGAPPSGIFFAHVDYRRVESGNTLFNVRYFGAYSSNTLQFEMR